MNNSFFLFKILGFDLRKLSKFDFLDIVLSVKSQARR